MFLTIGQGINYVYDLLQFYSLFEEDDEEAEDALYANFLQDFVGFEDEVHEDENDVELDDPDVADGDDPNDPDYIGGLMPDSSLCANLQLQLLQEYGL